jgi:hypothetical protein
LEEKAVEKTLQLLFRLTAKVMPFGFSIYDDAFYAIFMQSSSDSESGVFYIVCP